MGLLYNGTGYMKMTTLISMEIRKEYNKVCSPSTVVQALEDALCTLLIYRTSDFG